MAKPARAPLSIASMSSSKPGAAPAPVTVPTGDQQPVGRPRTLPENVRSMTLRLSEETHTALNVLAAQNRITAKAILMAGLADQFAKYGVTEEVR